MTLYYVLMEVGEHKKENEVQFAFVKLMKERENKKMKEHIFILIQLLKVYCLCSFLSDWF